MYKNEQTKKMIDHIKTEYGAEPEFLWPERFPTYSIYRHKNNRKWFALIGCIPSMSLGIEDEKEIDIINLKFDKGLFARRRSGLSRQIQNITTSSMHSTK